MRDLKSNLKVTHLLDAQALTTSTKSTHVDVQGADGLMFVVNVGEAAETLSGSVSVTPTLEHSDTTTDGDFAAVAAADMEGAFSVIDDPAEDSVTQVVGYKGAKRYVRVNMVLAGSHGTGTPASVDAVQGKLHQAPSA